MLREHFQFELPDNLIARQPTAERKGSRLLFLDSAQNNLKHQSFVDLIDHIQRDDLVVFNNTKVIPARLFGHKESGGKIELLIERVVDTFSVFAHTRASKSPKSGNRILFSEEFSAEVVGRIDDLFQLVFDQPVLEVLEKIGHMPLPPYIDREDTDADKSRYQTVFAEQLGAVAAPTAGLHFDQDMLSAIVGKGASIGFVTLHVGAGTFQPVRVDNIIDHNMHTEWLHVSQDVCNQVLEAKKKDGRVIAVGTTSLRCLETAAHDGVIKPFEGETDIFIYPGYQFKVVDALLTNFHLSESTLLMLVSAFAGHTSIMSAYKEAVREKYRFFSYGDAMFLLQNPHADQDIPK